MTDREIRHLSPTVASTVECATCEPRHAARLNTGVSSTLVPPMSSWLCMPLMRASSRRLASFSAMNSRLRCSNAVMAASLSASARRFCSSTWKHAVRCEHPPSHTHSVLPKRHAAETKHQPCRAPACAHLRAAPVMSLGLTAGQNRN